MRQPRRPTVGPGVGSGFDALLKKVHGSDDDGDGAADDKDTSAENSGPAYTDITATDLAARNGGDQVSDLLAASAAWLTLVEDKEHFTRREVMQVFDTLPGDHPRTLEARIKGYGKLVRSDVLILIDDGIFALSGAERERFQGLL